MKVLYVVAQPPDSPPGRRRGLRARALRGDAGDARRRAGAAGADRLQRGAPAGRAIRARPSARSTTIPNQYFVFTETEHFDFFTLTSRDKSLYSQPLDRLPPRPAARRRPLPAHPLHRLDLLSQIRRVLPDAAIVYTLHEFLPICHRDGQMVRSFSSELCDEASPRRCNECFPEITPAGVLPARALRQGAVRARRPLPRAERAADGEVPALGDRAGADRGRGVRPARRPRFARPTRAGQVAGQHRLLRPAQPLQGGAR